MLSELRLENFKAFGSRVLPLRSLTLLAGANGVGKSTTLQSLALLRQSFDAGTLQSDGLLLNGELVDLGTGRDVLHDGAESERIVIGVSGPAGSLTATVGYRSDADLLRFDESSATSASPAHRLVERLHEGRRAYFIEPPAPVGLGLPRMRVVRARAQEDLEVANDAAARQARLVPMPAPPDLSVDLPILRPGFQLLRADRVNPAVVFPKSHQAVVRRQFLGVRGEYTAHFLAVNRDRLVTHDGVLREPDAHGRTLLGQATSWMQEFSPGVQLDVHDIENTDFVRLEYRFGEGSFRASNVFRPTNVGFGLTYSLPIVVALLSARPGALILLENPEAHLHPQGQVAMGRLCALAAAVGVQVVVETHSDHVLNGIRLAVKATPERASGVALHFFRRDGKTGEPTVQSPQLRGDGRLSSWPDGFFDQWDKSLDALLD